MIAFRATIVILVLVQSRTPQLYSPRPGHLGQLVSNHIAPTIFRDQGTPFNQFHLSHSRPSDRHIVAVIHMTLVRRHDVALPRADSITGHVDEPTSSLCSVSSLRISK